MLNFDQTFIDEYVMKIVVSVLIFTIGWMIASFVKRMISKAAEKALLEQGIITFIASAVSISIRILTIVIVLEQFGTTSNVIVGAFSACALGISMALKSNMADVAGGLQILLTKPFKVGEYIKVDAYEGTVLKIELMYTVVQTGNLENTVIPNATIVGSILVNCSREGIRRIHLVYPFSLDQDVSLVQKAFLEVMEDMPLILKNHPKDVLVDEVTSSSVNVGIYCYVQSSDHWKVSRDLYQRLNKKRITEELNTPYDSVKLNQVS